LTLQFGSPALPVLGSQAVSGFRVDRFSGPGSGTYVIDDNYTFTLAYTLDPTNTFLSGSLISTVNGTEVEVDTDTVNDGTLNFGINGTANETYFHSGSHTFYGSLHVQLEDGSKISVDSSNYTGTSIDKDDPTNIGINLTYSITGGTAYISSTSNNFNTVNIEKGASGTIDWYATAASTDDGWTLSSVSPTSGAPSTRTVTTTGAISSLAATSNWSSNGLGSPTSGVKTSNKSYNRIVSLRYAAFANGQFSDDTTPTDGELLDLVNWTSNGESSNIVFGDTNPDGNSFSISWTGTKNFFIVYDVNQGALAEIYNDGFGSIGNYTTGTTTNYRYYILSGQVANPGGSSVTITLEK
jgi:hypothetical protein